MAHNIKLTSLEVMLLTSALGCYAGLKHYQQRPELNGDMLRIMNKLQVGSLVEPEDLMDPDQGQKWGPA